MLKYKILGIFPECCSMQSFTKRGIHGIIIATSHVKMFYRMKFVPLIPLM